jgi:uncharacterized membrane protein YdjX (TVP38/TMEM64 family)
MQIEKTKLGVLIIFVFGVVTPPALIPFATWFVPLFERIAHTPLWGPLLLGGLCAVAGVLPLPVLVPILAAGFLLGVFLGSLVCVAGTTVGGCAAFLLARLVGRPWVAGKMAVNGRLAALDRAVGEQGFKVVFLSRLSPITPFLTFNYAFGLTQVTLGQYAWGTLLGGAPGTILYVFFGAGLHSLHEVITYAGGEGGTTRAHRIFFWVSLIVTIVVTVWLTCWTRRALRNAMPAEPARAGERVGRGERTPPK